MREVREGAVGGSCRREGLRRKEPVAASCYCPLLTGFICGWGFESGVRRVGQSPAYCNLEREGKMSGCVGAAGNRNALGPSPQPKTPLPQADTRSCPKRTFGPRSPLSLPPVSGGDGKDLALRPSSQRRRRDGRLIGQGVIHDERYLLRRQVESSLHGTELLTLASRG